MANLVTMIEELVDRGSIEAVVIGDTGWGGDYNSGRIPNYLEQPRGEILSWERARPFLDYEFDSGFGAPSCNAIYAWTPNLILFVSQYDGATTLCWVPRHPINCFPEMPGG